MHPLPLSTLHRTHHSVVFFQLNGLQNLTAEASAKQMILLNDIHNESTVQAMKTHITVRLLSRATVTRLPGL